MDPVTMMLVTVLTTIANKLAEKAIIDPALEKGLEGFRDRLTKNYDQAVAAESLEKAMLSALEQMRTHERG